MKPPELVEEEVVVAPEERAEFWADKSPVLRRRDGLARPACEEELEVLRGEVVDCALELQPLPLRRLRSTRILSARTKTPCRLGHLKYRTSFTDPSFLPT